MFSVPRHGRRKGLMARSLMCSAAGRGARSPNPEGVAGLSEGVCRALAAVIPRLLSRPCTAEVESERGLQDHSLCNN